MQYQHIIPHACLVIICGKVMCIGQLSLMSNIRIYVQQWIRQWRYPKSISVHITVSSKFFGANQSVNNLNTRQYGCPVFNGKVTWLGGPFESRTFRTKNRVILVQFSDHHLNTRPFTHKFTILNNIKEYFVTILKVLQIKRLKLCQWVSLTYLGKTTVRTYTTKRHENCLYVTNFPYENLNTRLIWYSDGYCIVFKRLLDWWIWFRDNWAIGVLQHWGPRHWGANSFKGEG